MTIMRTTINNASPYSVKRLFALSSLCCGAAAVLLALAACSQDDAPAAGQLPIRLSSQVQESSVATTRGFNRINVPNGNNVYVWADMINLSDAKRSVYFNTWTLKANGEGGLQSDDVKFFPATNVLDLFAMAGSFSGYSLNDKNALPIGGINHTIRTDQRAEGAYYASDLLYTAVLGQEPIADKVELPLYHMLSKVQVVLIPGTGNTTDDNYDTDVLKTATVKLLGVETRARFTPNKSADVTDQQARAAMVVAVPKAENETEETKHDISVETVAAVPSEQGTLPATSFGDAIIVPQTIKAGKFISVTLADPGTGLTHETFFRFDDDFTFESGKLYRFWLTVDRIGDTYSLTPTIANWSSDYKMEGDDKVTVTQRPTDLK